VCVCAHASVCVTWLLNRQCQWMAGLKILVKNFSLCYM